jgi:hypothetical protein
MNRVLFELFCRHAFFRIEFWVKACRIENFDNTITLAKKQKTCFSAFIYS